MAKRLSVTIVGPGALGTALAKSLHAAGIPVEEIVYRSAQSAKRAQTLATAVSAKAALFREAEYTASVVWICVGDSAIAGTAARMASSRAWQGTTVFHSSGALTADELTELRHKGAKAASVHPMMTFVRSSQPSMKDVAFALEGDRAAVAVAHKLVKALGGFEFALQKQDKPLYHALGAFASPLIVAQMAAAERIGRELGFKPQQTRKIIGPILVQTIRNYLDHGPAAAFSGPIVRGDAATIAKNRAALKRVRGAAEIFRALAKVAVEELPSKDAKAVKRAIG